MSNSGQKMSTAGWCTFGLLSGVLVVAFGAFASATPQNKSEATLGQSAEKATSYTLVDQAVKVSSKQKPANIRKMSSTATLSAVQTGSSAALSIAGPGELARPSRSYVASATTPPEGLRTAQGDTGPSCATDFLTYDDGDWNGVNGGAPKAGWTDAGTVNDFILPDPDGGGTGTSFTCAQVMLIVDPGNEPTVMEVRVYDLNDVDGAGGGDGTILGMGSFAAAVPKCTRTYTTAGGTLTVVDTGHVAFGRPVMVLDGVGDPCDLYDGHFGFHVMFPGIGSFNFWATAPQDGNLNCLAVWGPVVDLPADFCAPLGDAFQAVDFKIGGVAIDCPNDVCGEGETTCNCSEDCGAEICGNGICCASQGEDCVNCEVDCGPCPPECGDGNCDPDEDECNCQVDCPGIHPNFCPEDSLFSQSAYCLGEPWTFGVSDVAFPAIRYESYSVDAPICDVHWWAGELDSANGFVNCQPNAGDMEIKFYADSGGLPDTADPVCTYLVTPTRTLTGDVYVTGGGLLIDNIAYDVDLPGCCELSSGWVSIQSQSAASCGIWWLSSGVGDGTSLIDTGGGPTIDDFDLSLCLTPAPCNSDGVCDTGENSCGCANDCGACAGTCVSGACCGDGVVEGHEECDFAGCGTCPWDTFPVDGDVGAGDLAFLLGNWGPIPKGADPKILCLDAEPDGDIGAFDLANVLGNWGPCPVGFGEDLCVEGDCDEFCECVGRGACCDVKGPGTCDELLTADECAIAGGNYVGDDTTCADCPHPACANADGGCCDANGTPGCDDPDCCAAVCELAPICCDEGWDSLCAGLAADVCAGGCPIPLDDCASPGTITDGDTSFDTTGGNTDGLPHADCQFDGQTYHDIWFNYDATCTGDLTVTTCEDDGGSAIYDTDLVVYDGCFPVIPCPPTDADLLGCNDDSCSVGFHSFLQVAVVANDCYTIRVGGWNDGDQGSGVLHLDCVPTAVCGNGVCEGAESCCSCPADCGACDGNDGCASAEPIFDGLTPYSTVGNTTCGNAHAACMFDGQTYHDEWFSYDATCTGDLTVTTCEDNGGSADYDTDLVVYDGCFPDIPCPPTDAELLGCNDDNCSIGFHSFLQVPVVANACYTIRVGGWNDGDQGTGNLLLDCVQGAVCGDAVCEGAEDCCNCPADCGGCVCGDGTCDAPCETSANCPADCPPSACGSCDAGGICDSQVGIQDQPDQLCQDGQWVSLAYPFPGNIGMVDTITMVNNTNTGGGDLYLMGSAPDCGGPDVNNILAVLCDGLTGLPTGVPNDICIGPVDTTGEEKVWVVAVFRSSFSFDIAFNSATNPTAEAAYGNLSGGPAPGEWQDLNAFAFGACYCVDMSNSGSCP